MSGNNPVVVALDVGGTSVKSGLVDEAGNLIEESTDWDSQSNRDAATILSRFEQLLRALWAAAGDRPIVGIGVGFPGPFDYKNGISLIKGLGKYDQIYGVNLQQDWRRRLGLQPDFPIRFVNDAAAFALGESIYGAAKGQERVLAITLGTGCGGCFVERGQILTEGPGVTRGGEVYHLPLRGGIIDDWISRRGILRLWKELQPDAPPADVKDLAAAARHGDHRAVELFHQWGALMAEALGPVAEGFRPTCMVVGGQISRSLPLFGDELKARLDAIGCKLVGSVDPVAAVRGAASLIWKGAQA